MKKQCQAIAKSTNQQCKIRSLPGSDYCIFHYPKKDIIKTTVFTIIGAILGLFIGVIFYDTLSESLSQFPLFYYLDKEKPIIKNVKPDIIANGRIYERPSEFMISAYDSRSGLDITNSKIELFYKQGQQVKKIDGELIKSESAIRIKPNNDLNYGEYLLKLFFTDKANNSIIQTYPFIIKEKEDINFTINCKPYNENSRNEIFEDFFNRNQTFKENKAVNKEKMWNFYVIDFYIENNTEGVLLKDINLDISAQFCIFT